MKRVVSQLSIVACRRIKALEFDKFVSIERWDLLKRKVQKNVLNRTQDGVINRTDLDEGQTR